MHLVGGGSIPDKVQSKRFTVSSKSLNGVLEGNTWDLVLLSKGWGFPNYFCTHLAISINHQVHEGLVHSVRHEVSVPVLVEVLHTVGAFASCIPISRLPPDLLPRLFHAVTGRLGRPIPGAQLLGSGGSVPSSRILSHLVVKEDADTAVREACLSCLARVLNCTPATSSVAEKMGGDVGAAALVRDLSDFACELQPVSVRFEALNALAAASRCLPTGAWQFCF